MFQMRKFCVFTLFLCVKFIAEYQFTDGFIMLRLSIGAEKASSHYSSSEFTDAYMIDKASSSSIRIYFENRVLPDSHSMWLTTKNGIVHNCAGFWICINITK